MTKNNPLAGFKKNCVQVWEDAYIADSSLGCEGEIRLVPDMESRKSCIWHPNHDMALATMHTAPGDHK